MPSVHSRNRAGIEFERIRAAVDPRFEAVVDALEDCYYGTPQFDVGGKFTGRATDGWKNGVSHPFVNGAFTYDWNPAPGRMERTGGGPRILLGTDAKAVFDKLHGLIWWLHHLALVDENAKQAVPDRYSIDKLDPFAKVNGVETTRRRSEDEAAFVAAAKLQGHELTV